MPKWMVYVTSTTAVLALIGGVFALDGRYLKAEDGKKMEQRTVQTLEQMQKNLDVRYETQRYQTLTDQMMQMRLLLKKSPNDPDLQEDYKNLKEERDKVKQNIDQLSKNPK